MQFTTKERKVVFYEKTGCAGNSRQKKVLSSQGIAFEVKSLLDTPWDIKSLEPFFKDLEKSEIVNESAPKIKKGEIDIDTLTKEQLITIMCGDPILIKRPLIEVGEEKICGFDIEKINKALHSKISETLEIPTCLSSDKCTSV